MEKTQSFLEGFGLDKSQIDVLLFLYAHGQTTVAEIARGCHIKRSTSYLVLDSVCQKGLANFIRKGSRRFYSAISPDEMRHLLTTGKEEAEKRLSEFDTLKSDFEALSPVGPDRPRIRYLEGRSGMRELFDQMLKSGLHEEKYVGSPSLFQNALGKAYLQKFVARRIALKIRSKAIWTWPYDLHPYKPGEQYLREVRYASKEFLAPTGVFIYGDQVSLLSAAREGFGVIVQSKDYFETMKSWFDSLWAICGEKPTTD
jgi:sugar-specific transcriptional regulator TrmB